MPLRTLSEAQGLVYQTAGHVADSPLVYLPGVHGDWTAQSGVRRVLGREFHFIETAYPHIERWSIADYGRAVKDLLDGLGIESAHLVGESFGSLVAWEFGVQHPERVRSFTLVGGFSRAPRLRVAATAASALRTLPSGFFEAAIDVYVAGKSLFGEQRERFDTGPYPATRTPRGIRATANRMSLIQETDFRDQLSTVRFPVRYLGGARDLVIPVRREIATLDAHLPPHCDFQSELITGAPHNVIASHPRAASHRICRWIRDAELQILGVPSTDNGPTTGRDDRATNLER